jgi:NAD(P)-dependent dehydrogenase (short-subunit alcohol dehydrogenase family)
MAGSDAPLALIAGASRGLGLGLAEEFLRRGWRVLGTVRGPDTGLHKLKAPGLEIATVDINDAPGVQALHDQQVGRAFDLIFVNAGIANGPAESMASVSEAAFTKLMVTNAYSPIRFLHVFQDLLAPGGIEAVMSSGLGSVSNNTTGGWEAYRASKAALNTMIRSYAARSPAERTILTIAPGWVRTDMGGPTATLDIGTSVRGMVNVITSRRGVPGHAYLNYEGHTLPW